MSNAFDSPDTEKTILSMMMLDKGALYEAVGKLTDDDFYTPVNADIFTALQRQANDDKPTDMTAIATVMASNSGYQTAGGMDYLASLSSLASTASNIGFYIDRLRGYTARRNLRAFGVKMEQLAENGEGLDVSRLLDTALSEALALNETAAVDGELTPVKTIVEEALQEVDARQNGEADDGLPTGFACIDDTVHGFRPGQMIVIAGRPGMGKTTLGLNVACNAAFAFRVPTAVFSLEMGAVELGGRIVSSQTGIRFERMRDRYGLNEADWDKANGLYKLLDDVPLYVDDRADITLPSIHAECRRLQRRNGLGLVVIDYLQLMGTGRRSENRQQEVSLMSRQCKLMAKELGVPVIVLSQLNRSSEMRGDKVPQLSDLRESGSIEQDADMVFLVHRPDYYDPEERPGEADVILAKHRGGSTDKFALAFQGNFCRFAEMPSPARV